jgi:hypothetical protein
MERAASNWGVRIWVKGVGMRLWLVFLSEEHTHHRVAEKQRSEETKEEETGNERRECNVPSVI